MNEIIDERTGEIITAGEIPSAPPVTDQHTKIDLSMIGTLDTGEVNLDALREPLDENEVQIRPDGLVYLPWTWRSKRYNTAFGELAWALIPQGAPMSRNIDENNVLVVWGQWLVVKGHPIGFSYGECSYRPKNKTMSYGDACEGAKSNALSRIGKQLGMPDLDLWDGAWVAEWKKKYAAYIKNPDGDYPKMIWVRKDDKRYQGAKQPNKPSKPTKAETKKEEKPLAKEVTPSNDSKPVDEAFPKDGWTPKEIKANKQNQVTDLIKMTGKKPVEIMNFLKTLDEKQNYSLFQIEDMLKGDN